jgi:DNA repair protein RecN (Recombination protein N)
MLARLRVRDLVVVEEATLEFGPGLNVVTGETGTGKSLILGALGLVTGRRPSGTLVRPGAERARVEAVFAPDDVARVDARLHAIGLDRLEDEWLILRRELRPDGKSRAFVGDQQVLVSTLRALGDGIVDVHGQAEGHRLARPARQRECLDLIAESAAAERLRGLLREERTVSGRIADVLRRRDEVASQREFFEHQLAEIRAANLSPDEEDELRREREILLKSGEIAESVQAIRHDLVEAENATLDRLGRAARELARLAAIDASFTEACALLESARIEIEDVAATVARRVGSIDFSPERRDAVEARLDRIAGLKRKYRAGVRDLLERAMEIERLLRHGESDDEELGRLERERAEIRREAAAAADRLAQDRREAARRLTRAVMRELPELGMKGARFGVELNTTDDPDSWYERDGRSVRLGPHGAESVRFMLSANPGHPLAPLARAASGGELSRVMLALTVQFAARAPAEVIVFDEVDAGVGGETAVAVGARIESIAASRQVIAITHLASVACRGRRQFSVEKTSARGRPHVQVRPLDEEDRVGEIARMLSGGAADAAARGHARELLSAHGGGRGE